MPSKYSDPAHLCIVAKTENKFGPLALWFLVQEIVVWLEGYC